MAKKYTEYYGRESDMQKSVARYLDSLGVLWFHPPNGGTRNGREGKYLKAEGVKSGVPDIVILEPRGKYHGLFIELKTSGGKVQSSQKEWLKKLEDRNYKTLLTRSIDELIDVVEAYLKDKVIIKVDPRQTNLIDQIIEIESSKGDQDKVVTKKLEKYGN